MMLPPRVRCVLHTISMSWSISCLLTLDLLLLEQSLQTNYSKKLQEICSDTMIIGTVADVW